jgi:hypothetical protein
LCVNRGGREGNEQTARAKGEKGRGREGIHREMSGRAERIMRRK